MKSCIFRSDSGDAQPTPRIVFLENLMIFVVCMATVTDPPTTPTTTTTTTTTTTPTPLPTIRFETAPELRTLTPPPQSEYVEGGNKVIFGPNGNHVTKPSTFIGIV